MKIKNWEAILGDCLSEMRNIPDESVDCVITDPPFAKIQTVNGFALRKTRNTLI